MYVNTTGIVLRETAYKDSSKILTVLTASEGKKTVNARGALRKNSKLAAATELLVLSEMTLFSSRDRWTLTEARSIQQFIGLRDDIELLALGAYFAELTEAVADEDSPNQELLPLICNALFVLCEKLKTPNLVKPAFELRLMSISGFAPLLEHCAVCGSAEPQRVYFDYVGGTFSCGGCVSSGGAELGAGALRAARFIVSCSPKKLYNFRLDENALRELRIACEGYLLTHLDRSFRTLEYYKAL